MQFLPGRGHVALFNQRLPHIGARKDIAGVARDGPAVERHAGFDIAQFPMRETPIGQHAIIGLVRHGRQNALRILKLTGIGEFAHGMIQRIVVQPGILGIDTALLLVAPDLAGLEAQGIALNFIPSLDENEDTYTSVN